MSQFFNNVFMPSDLNGTGCWRGTFAINCIWALGPKTNINNTVLCNIVKDQDFYKSLNMFMVQRLVNKHQEKLFNGLIVPYSNMFSFWTVYNIDDAMHYNDIVHYNRGRCAYADNETQNQITRMLNNSDFVLTTTDYIKNYYNRTYGVPLENIICIPNYLPKWWIGGMYDKEKAVDNFRKNKQRPRIGIISSLSHYNIDKILEDKDNVVVTVKKDENGVEHYINENGIEVKREDCHIAKDDLDLILTTIKKTVDEFQWIIFGYVPEQLKEYVENRKILIHPGVSILNYPNVLHNLNLNAVVAPVIDCEFNRCKSNIKYLECCATGLPLFASDIVPYQRCVPESRRFKDADDLYNKLMKFKGISAHVFEDIIESQWRWLNSKHNECGIESPNWWLEDNLHPWIKLFSMRPKPSLLSFGQYLAMKNKHLQQNIMFADEENDVYIYI